MQSKGQEIYAGDHIRSAVENRLRAWKKNNACYRLWDMDPTLWKQSPAEDIELSNRLGWLNLPSLMQKHLGQLNEFAEEIKKEFDNIVLLGMGGSSLAPEVFSKTFGKKKGYPALKVLDSTHPLSVRSILDNYNLNKTLFVVSSKSGGTTETMSFFYAFYESLSKSDSNPGKHFIAITDEGSSLDILARDKNFRKIFITPGEVGGRYSALTYFGLVPAALIGIDIVALLKNSEQMENSSSKNADILISEGFRLGALLGELNLRKIDKLTFLVSPSISSFPSWIEQLVAESTGKEGKGIIPVILEPIGDVDVYSKDRVFIYYKFKDDDNLQYDNLIEQFKSAGFPVVIIYLDELYDLGKEIYKWEIATAMAGSVLEINPFDQPNVQLAKSLANESMEEYKKTGMLPLEKPAIIQGDISLFGKFISSDIKQAFNEFVSQSGEGDYFAIQSFLPFTEELDSSIDQFKIVLRNKFRLAVTSGYGPRFLHSTGQLHKGDGNKGLFIQFTSDAVNDLDVTGRGYSFNTLITAQAQGDLKALRNNGRRVIRIHLSGNIKDHIDYLTSLLN
jgi:transaldolase / glucose-6-phosphate isomerase